MKKIVSMFICLAAAFVLSAGNDGNLLNNWNFSSRIDGVPVDWNTNLGRLMGQEVKLMPGKGPGKSDALRLTYSRKLVSFGQGGIKLVPGEKYRVGAYIRTENFEASRSGIAIANYDWVKEVGTKKFPKSTNGKWVKFEEVVTCIPPHNKFYAYGSDIYSFNIYAVRSNGGYVDVAAPYLIPVSGKAISHSRRSRSFYDSKEVVPIRPLLTRISAAKPEITLYWPYDKEAVVSASIYTPMTSDSARGEFKNSFCTLKFKKLHVSSAILRIWVYDKKGKRLAESGYPVKLVADLPATPVKKLNNLVGVIKDEKAKDGTQSFVLEDNGWLFFAMDSGRIFMDGKEIRMEKRNGRLESMVYTLAGKHSFRLNRAKGRFMLRTIPEIMVFPFEPKAKTNFSKREYDYHFLNKYLMGAVNSFNANSTWHPRGVVDRRSINWLKASGRRLTASGGLQAMKWDDPVAFTRDMLISRYDGRAIDELKGNSGFSRISTVADALWMLQNAEKTFNIWLLSVEMFTPYMHHNLISAQANAGKGQSKFMAENYISTHDTMKEQLWEIHRWRDHFARIKAYRPEFCRHLIAVSGGYSVPGGYFTAYTPNSDPKYGQDMFFQMLAKDPVFAGLYGIGVYSINSGDEEMKRWFGALFRHYGIEGNTTLLSDKYGFKLNPGFLQNGDFEKGLAPWKKEGKVEVVKIKDYGKRQGRKPRIPDKVSGDQAAVFYPTAGKAAVITQQAKGLTVGKSYSITYVEADRKVYNAKGAHKNKTYLVPELKGAKVIQKQDFFTKTQKSAFVVRKIIFKAEKPVIEVKFTAPAAAAGKEIMLNYVAFRPYFEN